MVQPRPTESLKILSFLLQFPEKRNVEALRREQDLLLAAFQGCDRMRMQRFVQYLLTTPLLSLQEVFSATFDLNPQTCLHLTYHQWGDDQQRGRALTRFSEACEAAGFEPRCAELPDYLPLVLELLSQETHPELQWIINEQRQTIRLLRDRLQAAQSPYADIFQVLDSIFEVSADDRERERI